MTSANITNRNKFQGEVCGDILKIAGSVLLIATLIFIIVIGIMYFNKSYPLGATFGHVCGVTTALIGIMIFGCLWCNCGGLAR